MDKENLFNFPDDFPYEFTSTDDKPKTFKEPTLGPSGCSHIQPLMPPVFAKGDEDAWNMIYAAASQVARMKMKMSNKDVTGVPHAFNRPHRSSWQQHFCPQVQNQRHQHGPIQCKSVVLDRSSGRCDDGDMYVKRECAGTGVFLPRRYCDNPAESRIRQGSPSNLAGIIQSSAKSFIPVAPPQNQTYINGGFISHYELFMDRHRSKGVILAAQQPRRGNVHDVVMESSVNNPAVLLPQEWTY
ncbi:hypothetical protein HanRHA438_Chr08g0345011 [Helianthus annuus]|uniref:Uncharacterized protein n=1 Tax=Helianthus annuus TaxID=4232 RepID=A0A251U4L4_HELAN|nr:uncharacterized protein LOC110872637 isoform X2 [Helianthus annuus]KAF5794921.1 hypothetical protein HanXRQr2_Chr08g0333691 [Helianthus annuus]KAJ0546386.1 hypothetical protein HanIR_Chr08g0360351 [Helianthus annuus]KAJ0897374.1 hypothetical protein HanRHA438_Chr08g0345011 [Helianthus annuus]